VNIQFNQSNFKLERVPSVPDIMGGLKPLEFKDCLTDSPYFRENLHAHEKELDRTSSQIKVLVKDVKEILNAARCK
jgi:hypothetical protein